MATKEQVLALRAANPEWSPQQIAARLMCKDAYVRATLARASGYKPPRKPKPVVISIEEQIERALDHRDLDILSDLEEGHSQGDCAKFYGVPKSYIQRMAIARKGAA